MFYKTIVSLEPLNDLLNEAGNAINNNEGTRTYNRVIKTVMAVTIGPFGSIVISGLIGKHIKLRQQKKLHEAKITLLKELMCKQTAIIEIQKQDLEQYKDKIAYLEMILSVMV